MRVLKRTSPGDRLCAENGVFLRRRRRVRHDDRAGLELLAVRPENPADGEVRDRLSEGEGGGVRGDAGVAHPASLVGIEGEIVVLYRDAACWRFLVGVKGPVFRGDGKVFAWDREGGGDLGEDEALVLDDGHVGLVVCYEWRRRYY